MPNSLRLNDAFPEIRRSEEWFARAQRLIPAGTQTLAKGPTQHVGGVAPKYLHKGRGARVWDVDGNEYLDFSMAIGPVSLGYAYPAVDDAIRAQLEDGITFSLMHPLEVEVAETIRTLVPCAESVRFGKTGAEVTSAAVRLARAWTGRNRVLCCGYHGWHDWYIAVTDRSAGVPEVVADLTWTIPYNDLDAAEAALGPDTACVILEPASFAEPHPGYLQGLLRLCRRRDVLLVFDEMWTGFRLATGGAQERFGVTPDLACFSKAVANGMPLSVLAGRADVMALLEEDVFFFGTFGGEALSLAAARATLDEMRQRPVFAHIARLGRRLKDGYNARAERLGLAGVTTCVGFDERTMVTFRGATLDPLLLKSFVQQELIRRGILWAGFHNLSYSHTEAEIEYSLEAYGGVLEELARAIDEGAVAERLRGRPVQPVFRRTGGFDTKPVPARKLRA